MQLTNFSLHLTPSLLPGMVCSEQIHKVKNIEIELLKELSTRLGRLFEIQETRLISMKEDARMKKRWNIIRYSSCSICCLLVGGASVGSYLLCQLVGCVGPGPGYGATLTSCGGSCCNWLMNGCCYSEREKVMRSEDSEVKLLCRRVNEIASRLGNPILFDIESLPSIDNLELSPVATYLDNKRKILEVFNNNLPLALETEREHERSRPIELKREEDIKEEVIGNEDDKIKVDENEDYRIPLLQNDML